MGNTIIYNGQEYGNPIVNDTGVGEYTSNNKEKNPTGSNNEIFNSYGGIGVNTIESVEENGVIRNSTYGHAEGLNTHIYGADNAHVEGASNTARGHQAHAEGQNNQALGNNSHAEGSGNTASGAESHVEGNTNTASGDRSHAEGSECQATGEEAHAEGQSCIAYTNSHAEGNGSKAITGTANHAEGWHTTASGNGAHSEGNQTTASGGASHAEGQSTIASGVGAHAEGINTQAISSSTHAEGDSCIASGSYAHAEGYMTVAAQAISHAEGSKTQANGPYSHAEGDQTTASGEASHAQNLGTIASEGAQTAIGKYNASNAKAALIIGNGNSTSKTIYLYDSDSEYSIGGKVKLEVEEGIWKIYECIEAIQYPSGSFDVSKWNDITSNYTIDSEGNVSITTRSNALTVGWDGSIVAGQQTLISEYNTNILATGQNNTINVGGTNSTVEGSGNIIQYGALNSHAEGNGNIIQNNSGNSHAEGENNIITDGSSCSHIEGKNNIIANGAEQCHVQNLGNVANSANQTIIGKYNKPDENQALIIGNGLGSGTTVNGVWAYSESSSYVLNDYCFKSGLIFKCIEATPNPAGSFDNTKWEVQNATYDSTTGIATLRASSNAMTVSWDGVLNVIGQNADIQINGTSVATGGGGDVANPNISDAYSSSSTYSVGDYCIYNNILYKCNTAISVAEAFDSSKWTQTTVGTELLSIINRVSALETALNGYSFSDN